MVMSEFLQIDKSIVRGRFNTAAERYESFDFLQREVSSRLFSRLDDIVVSPHLIVDLGSGSGRNGAILEKLYRKARVINLDLAEDMLLVARKKKFKLFQQQQFVCGDLESIPFRPGKIDLAFSNLALQWCPNLPSSFAQINETLKSGGLFIFSTLGPDTLKELKEVSSGLSDLPLVGTFLDMHIVGDNLALAGFADPVIESEIITVNYSEPLGLFRDLKGLGASNADSGRRKSLTGTSRMRRILKEYSKYGENGKVPATYEVILGHAWATKKNGRNEYPIKRLR